MAEKDSLLAPQHPSGENDPKILSGIVIMKLTLGISENLVKSSSATANFFQVVMHKNLLPLSTPAIGYSVSPTDTVCLSFIFTKAQLTILSWNSLWYQKRAYNEHLNGSYEIVELDSRTWYASDPSDAWQSHSLFSLPRTAGVAMDGRNWRSCREKFYTCSWRSQTLIAVEKSVTTSPSVTVLCQW